jgi:hypothetical protein
LSISGDQREHCFAFFMIALGVKRLKLKESLTFSNNSTPSWELISHTRRWFKSIWEMTPPADDSNM